MFESFLRKDPRKLPVVLPPAFWIVSGIALTGATDFVTQEALTILETLKQCWRGNGWASSCEKASPVALLPTYSAILIFTILKVPIREADVIIKRLKAHLDSVGYVSNHLNSLLPRRISSSSRLHSYIIRIIIINIIHLFMSSTRGWLWLRARRRSACRSHLLRCSLANFTRCISPKQTKAGGMVVSTHGITFWSAWKTRGLLLRLVGWLFMGDAGSRITS